MASPDAVVLTTSDLNPFLFARVGTETNGCELTILSILARLGSDPWAEAAGLAALPKAAATDWLAERIGVMPLDEKALDDPHATASRLVLLLPARTRLFQVEGASKTASGKISQLTIVAVVLAAIVLGFAASSMHGSAPAAPTTATEPSGGLVER